MGFLSFLALLGIAYLIWRVTDQLPDLIFRLSEVQRDVAEIRRRMTDEIEEPAEPVPTLGAADAASASSEGVSDV